MKKILTGLMGALLALCLILGACAEGSPETDVLEQLAGQTLVFTSGVGGWETSLTMGEDGAFTGLYHDSEIGEMDDAYPDGTVYMCLFHGRLTDPVQENTGMWRLTVSLTPDEGQEAERIEEGVRYLAAEPYGLRDGQQVILYMPGTPMDFLPEALLPWTHMEELDPHATTLPFAVIWNEAEESGFAGEAPEELLSVANPWTETTEEALAEATGLEFGPVEGAQDQRWFLMEDTGMAEERFTLGDCALCFRVQETDAFTDISGVYASWEAVGAFNIAWCPGTLWADNDGESPVQLCLWYDAAEGLMYSLSAQGQLPEGTELTAVAQTLCAPMLNAEE